MQQMAEVTREGFRLKKILIEDWKKAREEKQVRGPLGLTQDNLGPEEGWRHELERLGQVDTCSRHLLLGALNCLPAPWFTHLSTGHLVIG